MASKNYQTTTMMLGQREIKAINDLAMKNLKLTGNFSRSEAARQLINAGAEAMKNVQNPQHTGNSGSTRN